MSEAPPPKGVRDGRSAFRIWMSRFATDRPAAATSGQSSSASINDLRGRFESKSRRIAWTSTRLKQLP